MLFKKINTVTWTIAKRASDVMTQTRLRQSNWNDIDFPKHFLESSVVLKHVFEMKTLPRFPLSLSEHAHVL